MPWRACTLPLVPSKSALGVITLVGGSFTPKAIVWAAFFLVLAALQFSVGYWYLAIVRSAAPQT